MDPNKHVSVLQCSTAIVTQSPIMQVSPKATISFMVTTYSRSTTRTTDCVLMSWAERNLGRYEHARARRARARARVLHYDSVLHSYFVRVRGSFFCTTNMGKLLQHKLIREPCTKFSTTRSTRVPLSPVPQYGYSV